MFQQPRIQWKLFFRKQKQWSLEGRREFEGTPSPKGRCSPVVGKPKPPSAEPESPTKRPIPAHELSLSRPQRIKMVKNNKRKKQRRGGRKRIKNNVNKCDEWTLYLTNIRNLDSKRTSLESILSVNQFSVVIINETHFQSGRKV